VARYKVKAAILREFLRNFSVEEVELEAPNDWALVDVKSVGVCGRDLVVWRGGFRNLKPPLILGHEVFGVYKGKPVAVYPAIVGEKCKKALEYGLPENLCSDYTIIGEEVPGGYSTQIAVPPWNLIPLPDEDYDKYAAAACGVATLIHVSKVAGITGSSRVLVTGASGGVGIHGIQYLKLLGLSL